jgi:hypothetical protein
MADTPTPNAKLADELERFSNYDHADFSPYQRTVFMQAAAALRAPTIASAGISDETLASALLNEQELARLRAELWKAQHPNIEINEGKTNG